LRQRHIETWRQRETERQRVTENERKKGKGQRFFYPEKYWRKNT
jgi:hypothetical protein